jgi:hypothetical protein
MIAAWHCRLVWPWGLSPGLGVRLLSVGVALGLIPWSRDQSIVPWFGLEADGNTPT